MLKKGMLCARKRCIMRFRMRSMSDAEKRGEKVDKNDSKMCVKNGICFPELIFYFEDNHFFFSLIFLNLIFFIFALFPKNYFL